MCECGSVDDDDDNDDDGECDRAADPECIKQPHPHSAYERKPPLS